MPYLVPKNPVHTGSCSKESNHEQTTLTAACLGCTEVRRGGPSASSLGSYTGVFSLPTLKMREQASLKCFCAVLGCLLGYAKVGWLTKPV